MSQDITAAGDIYECSCGATFSDPDVRDIHEANGHTIVRSDR